MKVLHSQSDAAKIQFRRRCKKEQRRQKARVEKFVERDSREEAGFHRRCEFRCFHDVLNSLVCRGPCIRFNGVSTAFQRHAPRFGGIVVISEERRKHAALFPLILCWKYGLFRIFPSRLVHNFQKCETRALDMISLQLPYKIKVQRKIYTRDNTFFPLSRAQIVLEKQVQCMTISVNYIRLLKNPKLMTRVIFFWEICSFLYSLMNDQ